MIDSGSSRDMIDIRILNEARLIDEKLKQPLIMSLADDSSLSVQRKVENVKIIFTAQNHKHFIDRRDLYVMDFKGRFDIILGQPFLCSRNPSINWNGRTMKLTNRHPKQNHNMIDQIRTIHARELVTPVVSRETRSTI